MSTSLQLWTNDVETFVARDRDHLQALYLAHYGDTMEDMTGDAAEIDNWEPLDPDQSLTIWAAEDDEDDSWVPESATRVPIPETERPFSEWVQKATAKASEWAESHGEGFLCSTEY